MQGLDNWLHSVPIDLKVVLAGAAAALLFAVVLILVLRAERARLTAALHLARVAEETQRLAELQAQLAGRLDSAHSGLDQRLDGLSRRLGDGLVQHGEQTGLALRAVHERLAVIDAAQGSIHQLAQQVTGLQELLSNKQARGAFGEVQLHDLVSGLLPPGAFQMQATLSNRARVDCLLHLPDPPGPIGIDAKFPLESFRLLRAATDASSRTRAARQFAQDVQRHIQDIAAKYIIPGETADSALMFLPSEAVYAELHGQFGAVVEQAFRAKVWIVSPTTLWATLNTVRGVLRDVQLREHAHAIQAELRALAEDLGRLDERASNVQRHFDQALDDVRQIRISADKAAVRAARIDLSRLAAAPPPADATPSDAALNRTGRGDE
jgi:DNA recombination protein RmuC